MESVFDEFWNLRGEKERQWDTTYSQQYIDSKNKYTALVLDLVPGPLIKKFKSAIILLCSTAQSVKVNTRKLYRYISSVELY